MAEKGIRHVIPRQVGRIRFHCMFCDVPNHVRECCIMGSCHTINRQFLMGDVCRSRNASLSEHRSAYNGVKSVSEPFCQRLECRNIGGHNIEVHLYIQLIYQ